MPKYYVTMTDRFMSGWGHAKDKINKLVIECDSIEDALIVESNALARSEMKYINITDKKPYYNQDRYFVSRHGKDDYSSWFKPDYFKNQEREVVNK